MSMRDTLSSLYYLPIVVGATLWQFGCSSPTSPDDVITKGDLRVPEVYLKDMNTAGEPVLVGIGSSYKITWTAVNPPPGSVVTLYLTRDNTTLDNGSIIVTPAGGVAAETGEYVFSPVPNQGVPGEDYFLAARLSKGDSAYDTDFSVRKCRIGAGGIVFTNPGPESQTIARGDPVEATWDVTNQICDTMADRRKVVHLYIDSRPVYDNETSIDMTPPEGIDVCLRQFTVATGNIQTLGTPLYIIARVFIENDQNVLIEHSRAATQGTFTLATALQVTNPQKDVKTDLSAIPVTWVITGATANRKIEVLAQLDNETTLNRVISPEGGFDAGAGMGTVDASLLPSGTYKVVVRMYTIDAKGVRTDLDMGTAPGRIIISGGYARTYDLADMAAVKTRNYSPIDGMIFEGFNIGDEVGYEVAAAGDVNGDNFSDVMIFSRYGLEYTAGNAGSVYLIYGKSTWQPVINLNSVASPASDNRPVDGTLMLFPLENSATYENGEIRGSYKAIGLPDVSGDGKGDILIGCPEAKPLQVIYENPLTTVTLKADHYGLPRTLPEGTAQIEPSHVHSYFSVTDDNGLRELFYPGHYSIGDTITVTVVNTSPVTVDITVTPARALRGTSYLLTSNRLAKYANKVLDLSLVGSASELDEMSNRDREYDDMKVWNMPDQHFARDISVLPDINGNGTPEFVFTIPEVNVNNFAIPNPVTRNNAGKAIIVASEVRGSDSDVRIYDEPDSRGSIRWIGNSTWYNSSASASNSALYEVHILGAEPDSRLTSVAGLGQFTSLINNSSYTGGDFNGDNVPDFVVGCPGEQNGRGAIYVVPVRPVFGHRMAVVDLANFNRALPPGTDANLEIPVVGIKLIGSDPTWQLGEIVRPAGDFNGDGLADVVIAIPKLTSRSGLPEAGRVIIMFGQKDWYGDFTADQLDSHLGTQLPALIFEGEGVNDHLGQRIVCVGDVNGDNISDLLVAAPDAGTPDKPGCGKVYLIYGKKNIIKKDPASGFNFVDYDGDGKHDDYWSVNALGNKFPGAVFVGEAADNHLQAISPAGDVNGDGLADFIIGAPFTNVGTVQKKAGKAYLIFGRKLIVQ